MICVDGSVEVPLLTTFIYGISFAFVLSLDFLFFNREHSISNEWHLFHDDCSLVFISDQDINCLFGVGSD